MPPSPPAVPQPTRSAENIRPFIGTAGDGHTAPGAHVPFGMIYLTPVNHSPRVANANNRFSSGYQRDEGRFYGMAHNAVSGAGICLGQDLVVSPFLLSATLTDETATAGYYAATIVEEPPMRSVYSSALVSSALPLGGKVTGAHATSLKPTAVTAPSPPTPPPPRRVSVELTAGVRYGVHRYRIHSPPPYELHFRSVHGRLVPPWERARQGNGRSAPNEGCAIDGQQDSQLGGQWAKYTIFFYAELSVPCNMTRDKSSWGNARGALRISLARPQLELRIAISYVSQAGARRNFAHEHAEHGGFAATYRRARSRWEEALATVRVAHTSRQQKVVFDTALYHIFLSPYVHSDIDGHFLGPDGLIHRTDFTYYSFLSTWDTYRAWGPLMCRTMPSVMLDIVRTGLTHHRLTGVLPRWTWAGKETSCMPGMHSLTLMWQAVAHRLTSASLDKQIYAAFLHTMNASSEFTSGWGNRGVNYELREVMSNDGVLFVGERNQQTVSEALEYAIMSHCVSRMASWMVDDSRVVERFARLARVYERLYDRERGYFSGLTRQGSKIPEKSPFHSSGNSPLWTEGSASQWLFHVPHDFDGLVRLLGRPLFEQRLKSLFSRNGTSSIGDTTGTIGTYAQGNEPSHHLIFWLMLLGKHEEAHRHLDRVIAMYTAADHGLIGNDDAGQLSAWYVCVLLGFYPVDPTNATMLRFPPRVARIDWIGPTTAHDRR